MFGALCYVTSVWFLLADKCSYVLILANSANVLSAIGNDRRYSETMIGDELRFNENQSLLISNFTSSSSLSQRSYNTYDQERGLIHSGRSGKMSSRQRTLERELETEDPSLVASSDDALASSDDGLEDNFIPRKSKNKYYMVKSGSDSDQGGSIYEKKNVDPPRKKSEGAGNRVRSRTGELFSNYERDQSFDGLSEEERGIEKPKTSVSILKAAYSKKAIDSKTVDRYICNRVSQKNFTS